MPRKKKISRKKARRKTIRRPAPRERERIAMISTHGYVAAEPPLGNPDTGGQVVYVLELSRKLAQLGYEVDIWTRQFEDQPAEEEVDEHVRILRMPCGGSDFIPKEYLYRKLPEWTEHALRYIRKEQLSYAFINSHYWDAGLAGQHLADALKVPHIHTPHSIGTWKKSQMEEDSPDSKEKLEKTYNFSRRIHHETVLYRECSMVVATSPMQLGFFKKEYEVPDSKVVMIPPGYDDNRFFPVSEATRWAIRESMNMPDDVQIVTGIGRLSRNKGWDLMIDAFAVVASKEPKARLHLALGSERDETTEDPMMVEIKEKIKEYKLGRVVTLQGSLPDEAMADFYRAGDVFCLPSRYEPFGMTAIEAMACGTPTVITTHGGLYRAMNFGTDCLYADSLDPQDFGYSILKILRHRGIRNRLALNGAHKVRSLFTWTGIAQQLVKAVEGRTLARLEISEED